MMREVDVALRLCWFVGRKRRTPSDDVHSGKAHLRGGVLLDMHFNHMHFNL